MFSVRIAESGWQFEADAELTLLEAAAFAGIILPSSCRNGSCRTCMSQLCSGEVAYRIAWPGLSAQEKQAGAILPCVAYPVSDLLIESGAAKCVPDYSTKSARPS